MEDLVHAACKQAATESTRASAHNNNDNNSTCVKLDTMSDTVHFWWSRDNRLVGDKFRAITQKRCNPKYNHACHHIYVKINISHKVLC